MAGQTTTIEPPPSEVAGAGQKAAERKPMTFSFDYSYWSAGSKSDPGYASQDTLYRDVGVDLLESSFKGINNCVFAYGQTGSGKSYSMMGYGEDKGIIPLTCEELFKRGQAKAASDPTYAYTVEVSYIEIYNEKVRDLLNPKNKGNLKVREHPSLGPYVEDLSKLVVSNYNDLMSLMEEGNKTRTVAATQMNETSSRSHAIFTLVLTQRSHDALTDLDAERVSRISLVDLAGSERANSTGATGSRLKEGANINKSLTSLGKVIAALAAASAAPEKGKGVKKQKEEHVPYRDSVLTWLLKDSLGGNSQTAMIAAIAPSSASYDETLSTLRYADSAKKIKTRAVVNEDPNAKMIRELKEELEMLRSRASGGGSAQAESFFDPTIPPEKQMVSYQTKEGEIRTVSKAELQDQMQASEKIMQSLNETWEEKMAKTEVARVEREAALEELGITLDKGSVGVRTPKRMPHLVNLNEDPLMSECLVYSLKPGKSTVGNVEAATPAAIRLSGAAVLDLHCVFNNEGSQVSVEAVGDALVIVNGQRLAPGKPLNLRSGFRLILGEHQFFRFNNPDEVRRHREQTKSSLSVSISAGELSGFHSGAGSPAFRPDSPGSTVDHDGMMDWRFAKMELARATLNGQTPQLDTLKDEDLDKLYDNIQKVRTQRKGRPESRMSISEDFWSDNGRHLSSNLTDDTSLNPWGGGLGTGGHTPNGFDGGTPSSIGGDIREEGEEDELNKKLSAQKAEYEARISTLESSASLATDQEDYEIERAHMQRSISLVSSEMKRLLQLRASGSVGGAGGSEAFVNAAPFTARQVKLVSSAVKKWREKRVLGMAERVLANSVKLKEANVLSLALDKKAAYNFFAGRLSFPTSILDAIGGILDIDEAGPSASSGGSSSSGSSFRSGVGVKVLDFARSAVYVWTHDQFLLKLAKMRNVSGLIGKPSFAQHFSTDEPFRNVPAPTYSFIGSSLVSLAPLSRGLSFSSTSPIFCRFTSEAIGSCRVTFAVQAQPAPKLQGLGLASPPSTSGSSASSFVTSAPTLVPAALLTIGSRLAVQITVDHTKGPSSLDFHTLHAQLTLSSVTGTSIASDETFHSSPVDLERSPPSSLALRRRINIVVTQEVLAYLQGGYAPVQFFAGVKTEYLDRLARHDDAREREVHDKAAALHRNSTKPATPKSPRPAIRRAETDFVVEEMHDVSSSIAVCELSASGEHVPTTVLSQGPVDPGCFHLRQGLQRRIVVSLTHTSGRALPWARITRISVGHVRTLGDNGQILETSTSKPEFDLKLLRSPSDDEDGPSFRPDGTSALTAEALWDSSIHDSILLNRPTPAGQRILLRLTALVEISTCEEPASFSLDLAFKVLSRSASGPGLLSVGFFGSARLLIRTSSVFTLRLAPPPTRSPGDLWRLDTSKAYVKGEEILPPSWRPRGVSVVQDYLRLLATEKRAADVQATEAVLALLAPRQGGSTCSLESSYEDREEELARKMLGLWQKQFGPRGVVNLERRQSEPDLKALARELDLPDLSPKMIPTARLASRSTQTAKKGSLNFLVDAPNNVWAKRFFVLRRPYLFVFESSSEKDELFAVNLSSSDLAAPVAVLPNPDIEHLLGRKFAFTLLSRTNSYVFQASSAKDFDAWRLALDPTSSSSTASSS